MPGLDYAIRALDAGGVCTTASMHFTNDVPIPFKEMYMQDAVLKVGKTHARREMDAALELVRNGSFDPGLFNTKTIDWTDAAKGYRERTTKLLVRR